MKAPPQSRNLEAELIRRRRCRSGLRDVAVRRPDGVVAGILSSRWSADRRLILEFADGRDEAAANCELMTEWPVVCCRPRGRAVADPEDM